MSGTGYISELRKTLLLATPIMAGHLSQMILGFVDTLMIGRVGVVPLAGAAFSNAVSNILFIGGIGLLTAVSVFVSHAYGAGDRKEAGQVLRRGLIIALSCGILIFGLIRGSFPFLHMLGQPEDVIEAAKPYLFYIGLSIPVALTNICFKNFSEAQNAPWPGFWTGLGAVFLNIFLNWVLIYGNLGMPAMGLEGAGIATLISRFANLFFLVAWLKRDARCRESWPMEWFGSLAWKPVLGMLRLGFPVALQLIMEIGAFGACTLLMGWIGVIEIAAHHIAITYAATTFMIPLGISLAVAIRVGHVIGGGEPHRARTIGFGSIGFGVLLSGVFATFFIVLNVTLVGFFTKDPATVAVASVLIIIAGFFQLFDGVQVLSAGALRGCKDVKVPTYIIFMAYWVIGIPVGSLLAFPMDFGATGIWIGLASGLGAAAIGLLARFALITRGSHMA
ncbi:MATE family efflux transporter [Puniceicoccales bacterium CK1056]|uniref:Multidrug-efflux transporter n=1 Tax=Oceanipulchritudo coccoides TaxID=2706888 RepID=A0A6B2LZN8_9BACT|nr:MATE family efflux transporter [Oceanipulchritudo coccoides]NDV60980.1 MATE family efflux transporter [Oceanipulchritudo coccoides]